MRRGKYMTHNVSPAGEDTWWIDEIEVEVRGLLTTHHELETVAGTWGSFTFPALSGHAVFRTANNGRDLLMRKTSFWSGSHELLDGDVVLGSADRRGLFRRDIVVGFRGQTYQLEPAGWFTRDWRLLDGSGNLLLEVRPRGVFRRGAYLTLRGAVDAELIAFTYYLVYQRQQEEAAAAAAAA
jgi:hypothetical protein